MIALVAMADYEYHRVIQEEKKDFSQLKRIIQQLLLFSGVEKYCGIEFECDVFLWKLLEKMDQQIKPPVACEIKKAKGIWKEEKKLFSEIESAKFKSGNRLHMRCTLSRIHRLAPYVGSEQRLKLLEVILEDFTDKDFSIYARKILHNLKPHFTKEQQAFVVEKIRAKLHAKMGFEEMKSFLLVAQEIVPYFSNEDFSRFKHLLLDNLTFYNAFFHICSDIWSRLDIAERENVVEKVKHYFTIHNISTNLLPAVKALIKHFSAKDQEEILNHISTWKGPELLVKSNLEAVEYIKQLPADELRQQVEKNLSVIRTPYTENIKGQRRSAYEYCIKLWSSFSKNEQEEVIAHIINECKNERVALVSPLLHLAWSAISTELRSLILKEILKDNYESDALASLWAQLSEEQKDLLISVRIYSEEKSYLKMLHQKLEANVNTTGVAEEKNVTAVTTPSP